MVNQESKQSFREALRKAETRLNHLRGGAGGDEAARFRKMHAQEKVVRAYRRLANISDKPKTEAVEINVNYIQ